MNSFRLLTKINSNAKNNSKRKLSLKDTYLVMAVILALS